MKPELGAHLSKRIDYPRLWLLSGSALLVFFNSVAMSIWVASIAAYFYPSIISGDIDIGYLLYNYAILVQEDILSQEPISHALAVFLVLFSYPWENLDKLIFALNFFLPLSLLFSMVGLILIGYGLVDEKWGISTEFDRRRILPSILYSVIFNGKVPIFLVIFIYEIEVITVWFVVFFSALSLLAVGAVGLPFALAFAVWKLRQG